MGNAARKISELERALMIGQGMSAAEAARARRQMSREVVMDGRDPEEVLYEYGLEPDYIFDIL